MAGNLQASQGMITRAVGQRVYQTRRQKPKKSGSREFVEILKMKSFPSASEIILEMPGSQLTSDYLIQNGFAVPILVQENAGLGLKIPPQNFSSSDVGKVMGYDKMVDVIDVLYQTGIRMSLSKFISYFNQKRKRRVLNLISLEVSGTNLGNLIHPPTFARELDWVYKVWPTDTDENVTLSALKPQVEKYCLMSVKDSFTDFHIDFGGTSVWYHLLWGEKIFYLIQPTPDNLSVYMAWMETHDQRDIFLGDKVDHCYKLVLKQGQTLVIPTGWIHAVLTPLDSLVFGGNFLHSLNIPLQLQVHQIESDVNITEKFLYPSFKLTNWFAACSHLADLRCANQSMNSPPNYLILGLKALADALKQWFHDKDFLKQVMEETPENANPDQVLKDMKEEITRAEKFIRSKTSKVPKRRPKHPQVPQRVSGRMRKSSYSEDFIYFNKRMKLLDHNKPPSHEQTSEPSTSAGVRQESSVNREQSSGSRSLNNLKLPPKVLEPIPENIKVSPNVVLRTCYVLIDSNEFSKWNNVYKMENEVFPFSSLLKKFIKRLGMLYSEDYFDLPNCEEFLGFPDVNVKPIKRGFGRNKRHTPKKMKLADSKMGNTAVGCDFFISENLEVAPPSDSPNNIAKTTEEASISNTKPSNDVTHEDKPGCSSSVVQSRKRGSDAVKESDSLLPQDTEIGVLKQTCIRKNSE